MSDQKFSLQTTSSSSSSKQEDVSKKKGDGTRKFFGAIHDGIKKGGKKGKEGAVDAVFFSKKAWEGLRHGNEDKKS